MNESSEFNTLSELVLRLHNEFRAKHMDTGPLVLDNDCCKTAQFVADLKVYEHSKKEQRNGYGENLAWSTWSTKRKAIDVAIKGFYGEIRDYNWSDPCNVPENRKVGHFTQMLWAKCTKIGWGVSKVEQNGEEGWMTVYHYSPGGNLALSGDENRLFYQNVRPPIGTDMSLPVFKKFYSTAEDLTYDDLCKLVVKFHNECRAKHEDTKPLVLDPECCKTAQFIADLKKVERSKGEQRNDHGESIAWSCHLTRKEAVEDALKDFYSEIDGYSWANPPRKNKETPVGNFTQMVWSETEKIGLGISRVERNGVDGWLSIFHYEPCGNYVSWNGDVKRSYGDNVKPVKPTVSKF